MKFLQHFVFVHVEFCGGCKSIIGVWRFATPPTSYLLRRSLPGHMIHLVVSGEAIYRIQDRPYHVQSGDIIYYYESEKMEIIDAKKTIRFYSTGFITPYRAKRQKAEAQRAEDGVSIILQKK